MIDAEINNKLRERGVADYLQGEGRDGLVARWRSFVEEVEQGYKLGIDDYQNDLNMREILEDVGLGNDPEVNALGERFRAQMQNTAVQTWKSKHPSAFWVRGYPLRLSESLARDLEAFGLKDK